MRWITLLVAVATGCVPMRPTAPTTSVQSRSAMAVATVTTTTTPPATTPPGFVEGPPLPPTPFVSSNYLSCPRVVGQRVRCQEWIAKGPPGGGLHGPPITWSQSAMRCDYDQNPMDPPDLTQIGNPVPAGSSGWCPQSMTLPAAQSWPACHCYEAVVPNPAQFGTADCDCFYPDQP